MRTDGIIIKTIGFTSPGKSGFRLRRTVGFDRFAGKGENAAAAGVRLPVAVVFGRCMELKKAPRVMVCVTRQKTCERLIMTGSLMAKEAHAALSVIHVERPGVNFLGNPSESEALEYLFQVSSSFDADMTVLRENDVVETLVRYVLKNHVVAIIMGRPPVEESESSIIGQLKRRLPDVNIMVV